MIRHYVIASAAAYLIGFWAGWTTHAPLRPIPPSPLKVGEPVVEIYVYRAPSPNWKLKV